MLEKRIFDNDGNDNKTNAVLKKYIYSNHLQSASLELDENGAIISYEEYHPYGTTSYQANNSDIKAVAKRYSYTGKERDEESGLYYHGARYYVPRLARWTAVDPLESKYAGMSSYNYCVNNPVKYRDDDGREIGLSKLSKDDKKIYDTIINNLNNSYIFRYVYDRLKSSDNTFTVNMTNEFQYGGEFDPNSGIITIGSQNEYIIAQELFHVFQYDNKSKLYNEANISASLEAEGDLFAIYVLMDMNSALLPKIGEWGEEIFAAFGGIYELPTVEEIKSEDYKEKFQNAVQKRVQYYKQELEKNNLNMEDIQGYIKGNATAPNALINAFEGGERLRQNNSER